MRVLEKINYLIFQSFRLTNMKGSEESELLSPTSASTTFSGREKKEKSLSRNSSNKDRDCVKYLNEKTSNNVSFHKVFAENFQE